MLQLVLGQSGSGKTHKVIQKLRDSNEEDIILIVPEQSSFDAEKTVCNSLPPQKRRTVEVLSFSRLCNNIFRRYGSLAGDRINDSGKCMLMSVALDSLKDDLKIYKNYHHRPEFIKRMASAADEFKNAGLTPERLSELCEGQTGASAEKLRELSSIYALYNSVLEGQGIDSRDDLARATAFAEENGYFKDKTVFIDGFKDFTGAQEKLVLTILLQSKDLIVSLCTDGLDSESVMFSSSNNTARFLIGEAKRAGIEIKTPELLTGTKRAKTQDLMAVAENFLRHGAESVDTNCENVKIYRAKDPSDEAEFIAASIGDLVKNHGYRYRDIAVVGRNTDAYASLLNDAFLRYDIPVFEDERDEISTKPLVKLVSALIASAENKNDTDSLFTVLKSPFSPFEYEKVCELENYCYIWGLTGKDLRFELKNHPDGLGKAFDASATQKLAEFNAMRRKTVELIDAFTEKTEVCDGLGFASEIYNFIKNFGVEDKIREQNDSEAVEVFNCTVACLEQMATVLKGMTFDVRRMESFLKTALLESDYGKIPQHLDEVTVGSANRIRYSAPKAVFVFGAVDGTFPALIKNDAVVGWDERAFLREHGINIPDNERGLYADERYFAYMAVSAPSEKLFVCYPAAELSGNVCFKSLVVSQIEKILPNVQQLTRDTVDRALFLQTRKGILHQYAEHFFEDDVLREAVRNTDDGAVAELEKIASKNDFDVNDTKLSASLFGKNISLSASKVESFYRCRFSYFCEKGLRIRPLQRIEMDPMQSGNFIHYCLYVLLSRHTKEEFLVLSSDEISKICDKIAEEYLEKELVAADFSDKRFITLMMRMKGTVKRIVLRLQAEFRQSDFVPVEFEAEFDKKGEIKPYTFTTDDGITVRMDGKVDRVDLLEKDDKRYLRVVDYKSGTKDFKLDDLNYGLNMQMLIYLFALCDENAGKYAGAEPVGVLYMPVGDGYDDDTSDEALEKERLKKYKMKGLLLDNEDVIRAMEKGGEGTFIPVRFKKDGSMSTKSVVGYEDFSEIKNTIQKNLSSMVSKLQNGKIAPMPTEAKGYTVCQYCRYAAVCKKAQTEKDDE